jgi:hypothetical protein
MVRLDIIDLLYDISKSIDQHKNESKMIHKPPACMIDSNSLNQEKLKAYQLVSILES